MHEGGASPEYAKLRIEAGTLRIASLPAGALAGALMQQPARPCADQSARDRDLQRRLARFRSRVASEARPNALEFIDAAVGQASPGQKRKGP